MLQLEQVLGATMAEEGVEGRAHSSPDMDLKKEAPGLPGRTLRRPRRTQESRQT